MARPRSRRPSTSTRTTRLPAQSRIALAQQGKFDDAIVAYKKALTFPTYTTPEVAYYNMGEAYIRLRKPQEAIESFRAAIQLEPVMVAAHYGLGLALSQAGRRDDAKPPSSRRETSILHRPSRSSPRTPSSSWGRGRRQGDSANQVTSVRILLILDRVVEFKVKVSGRKTSAFDAPWLRVRGHR
jgi:hypothetical protein